MEPLIQILKCSLISSVGRMKGSTCWQRPESPALLCPGVENVPFWNFSLVSNPQGHRQRVRSRLDAMERKRNIIMYGVPDNEFLETHIELEEKVLGLMQKYLHLNVSTYEIDFVRRYYHVIGRGPKPILVGLTTFKRKIEILNSFKNLEGSPVPFNITADYAKGAVARTIARYQKKRNDAEEQFKDHSDYMFI